MLFLHMKRHTLYVYYNDTKHRASPDFYIVIRCIHLYLLVIFFIILTMYLHIVNTVVITFISICI